MQVYKSICKGGCLGFRSLRRLDRAAPGRQVLSHRRDKSPRKVPEMGFSEGFYVIIKNYAMHGGISDDFMAKVQRRARNSKQR